MKIELRADITVKQEGHVEEQNVRCILCIHKLRCVFYKLCNHF